MRSEWVKFNLVFNVVKFPLAVSKREISPNKDTIVFNLS